VCGVVYVCVVCVCGVCGVCVVCGVFGVCGVVCVVCVCVVWMCVCGGVCVCGVWCLCMWFADQLFTRNYTCCHIYEDFIVTTTHYCIVFYHLNNSQL
jgi:hypothetical protein